MSRDAEGRFWLTVQGAHTHFHSTLCARCPYHVAGCCSHPPPYDWADVARVLSLGGRAHLERSLADEKLFLEAGGLRFATPKVKASPRAPRTARCVFLGERGCVLDPREKPAVCNYYVCDEALGGPPERNPRGAEAYFAYALVRELWTRWTAEIARVVADRYPDGPTVLDDALVALLTRTFARLEDEAGLAHLRPPRLDE